MSGTLFYRSQIAIASDAILTLGRMASNFAAGERPGNSRGADLIISQSAPRFPKHRQLQRQDNVRYFPAWYARAVTARLADCEFAWRSTLVLYAGGSGCHTVLYLDQYHLSSPLQFVRTGVWICGAMLKSCWETNGRIQSARAAISNLILIPLSLP